MIARAAQGVAGAMLAPAALATLVTTFRDPADRGKAFGVFGTVAVAGGAVGLILGGVLTEYLSWRWCMYVNVLFAGAAIVGALVYMVEVKPEKRPHIDMIGTITAGLGLFGIVFGFAQAELDGWTSPVTIISLALGVVLLAAFVVVEQRVHTPLLPMRVVADRSRAMAFSAVASPGWRCSACSSSSPTTCRSSRASARSHPDSRPADDRVRHDQLEHRQHRYAAALRAAHRDHRRHAAGLRSAVLPERLDVHSSYVAGVLPALMVMGLAMGSVMAPSMNTATAGVEPEDSGVAAALVSTMQQVGGSIGTALLSTIVASATLSYSSSHGATSDLKAVAATHGYTVAFLVSSLVFAGGAVLAAVFFPSKHGIAKMRESVAAAQQAPQAEKQAEAVSVEA